ncbi:OR1F1-like [Ictidomys tridecemlineatus]|uniref:G-protein coupled receptors family 1 profile domain-containing protein n=1 Tax=Ictidomys tridecemlineatus TaxID=43179 RepID=A0A287DC47_ICTTR|nr:OR1F1-like [Ictidomys tridecemlineatus]
MRGTNQSSVSEFLLLGLSRQPQQQRLLFLLFLIMYLAIPHFFCDVTPLLRLSCSDTHLNELTILFEAGLLMIAPFICILVSYILIVYAVLRVPSTRGMWKAFSTCSSHLAVVFLFYGTITSLYFIPSSSHSAEKDPAAAVMYTVVTPMLNPFIYSLRNRDLKGALKKVVTMKLLSTQK